MANPEHVAAVLKGTDAVRKLREVLDPRGVALDLTGYIFENGLSLTRVNFAGADLRNTELPKAEMTRANLVGAILDGAKFRAAMLDFAVLDGASLAGADLFNASLRNASLNNAELSDATLFGACLESSSFQGAMLRATDLRGASFRLAAVDGVTLIDDKCRHNEQTDFTGVGLETIRVTPRLRSRLEYYVRKSHWREWYLSQRRTTGAMVRFFWLLSDYGSSTRNLLRWFFGSIVLFALIYAVPSLLGFQPMLMETTQSAAAVKNATWLGSISQGLYFSVTVTTLGYSDIVPNTMIARFVAGIQVFWGYFLLAAIVTRLAILFRSID